MQKRHQQVVLRAISSRVGERVLTDKRVFFCKKRKSWFMISWYTGVDTLANGD
jgi:hypothetical protein